MRVRKDLLLSEVLTRVHNAPSEDKKAEILKEFETPGLLRILKYAFGPNIVFDCNVTEYNPSIRPAGMDYASLQGEARRLYIFTKDFQTVSPQRKREILLQILESVNLTEAKLLTQVLAKDVKVNGLTPELIDRVFPGLLHYRTKDGKTWVKYPDGTALQTKTIDSNELFNSPASVAPVLQGGPFYGTVSEPAEVKIKTPKPSKNKKVIV